MEHQLDQHQQPQTQPQMQSQAQAQEGEQQEQPNLLSPSAETWGESSQINNNISQSSHARNYHRWPSYALDVSHAAKALHLQPEQPKDETLPITIMDAGADAPSLADYSNANNLFLFSDQISMGGDNYNQHDRHPQNHRRVPINILKLPWQHPFQHHESNRNPYKIPRALFAAIFLTTTLALLSAWDAQNHCVSNETDALMALLGQSSSSAAEEYWSNEEQQQQYQQYSNVEGDSAAEALSASEVLAVKETCREMFRQTMIPVGLVTGTGSLVALGILRFHQQAYGSHRKRKGSQPLSIEQSPPCFYSFYLPLLFVSGLIVAAWTLGIISLMLRPRTNNTGNPYTSLAAVDAMGRVGDNANLYYLSWMSEGLAILIFYQLFGAFVRQHCPPVLPTTPLPATTTAKAATIDGKPSNGSTVSPAYNLPWRRQPARGVPMLPPHDEKQSSSNANGMDNSLVHQRPKVSSNAGVASPTSLAPTASTFQHLHHHHQHEPTAQRYHSSRMKWYQKFYGLRVRTGMWVAALLSSIVVVVSSGHMFNEILLPAAQSLFDDDDYFINEHQNSWWNLVFDDNKSYRRVCVILASQDSNLSEELCSRTFFSLLSGFAAIILCTTAIVLHFLTRRSAAVDALYFEACGGVYHELALQMMATKHHHLPLRSELVLSVVLSLWLGWNALLVSSAQGPAPRVGNLYYASWFCFFLCLRICLGCVEELINIQDDEDQHQEKHAKRSRSHLPAKGTIAGKKQKEGSSYVAPDISCLQEDDSGVKSESHSMELKNESAKTKVPSLDLATLHGEDKAKQETAEKAAEKERAKRLRRYFFLGAFSTVCTGSAYDAAKNQGFLVSVQEKYMILAPAAVALLSAVLFFLCLSKTSYSFVSNFWCGGVLSCIAFGIWLANMILTMHSTESWAVNGVGEIEMANLYYFSWAAIITAGLQMTSYFKEILRLESEEDMTIIWAAVGKVSFVILGAACHIWHTISDQCDIVEIQNSAITFCSRTILSMFVASTGMMVAALVVFVRVLLPLRYLSSRSRAHCETVLSIFLVFLFGAASGMITGIGGPGQSVGDLYYSTWLSFWVSIGIFVTCYDQIKLEELENQSEESSPTNGEGSSGELT